MTRGAGAGVGAAGGILVALAAAVALGLGPAAAAGAVSQDDVDATGALTAPDYTSGPFASRLCGGGTGDLVCVAARTAAVVAQGVERRADAVANGATCEDQSGLWVCFGTRSVLVQRGGTTYGDTFLTARDAEQLDPDLIAHESEHVRQWRLFGPDFALLYLLEGSDPCSNYFEVSAGLDAGDYTCS